LMVLVSNFSDNVWRIEYQILHCTPHATISNR